MDKNDVLHLRISSKLKSIIKDEAESNDVTMSKFVLDAIRDRIDNEGTTLYEIDKKVSEIKDILEKSRY